MTPDHAGTPDTPPVISWLLPTRWKGVGGRGRVTSWGFDPGEGVDDRVKARPSTS